MGYSFQQVVPKIWPTENIHEMDRVPNILESGGYHSSGGYILGVKMNSALEEKKIVLTYFVEMLDDSC